MCSITCSEFYKDSGPSGKGDSMVLVKTTTIYKVYIYIYVYVFIYECYTRVCASMYLYMNATHVYE